MSNISVSWYSESGMFWYKSCLQPCFRPGWWNWVTIGVAARCISGMFSTTAIRKFTTRSLLLRFVSPRPPRPEHVWLHLEIKVQKKMWNLWTKEDLSPNLCKRSSALIEPSFVVWVIWYSISLTPHQARMWLDFVKSILWFHSWILEIVSHKIGSLPLSEPVREFPKWENTEDGKRKNLERGGFGSSISN